MKKLYRLLIIAVVAYAGLVAYVFVIQRSLTYFPDTRPAIPSEWQAEDMLVETAITEDGLTLSFWYKPSTAPKLPTILFFHGNAQHHGYRMDKMRDYMDKGYGLLLASYRGYSGNPGKPTEKGLFRDARAALALLERKGIASKDIVLYGESLGTGVATRMAFELASGHKPAHALVLESPFTSLVDVAAFHYPYLPVRWLSLDRFDSLSLIKSVNTPVMIIHSQSDEIVPFELGKKLYDTASEPKYALFLNGVGHNNPPYREINKEIIGFIGRIRPLA